MSEIKLQIREALDSDITGVVALFCEEGGNPYNWSVAKWRHYYRDYPEGKALSLVVSIKDRIVGHYGMVPVQIGGYIAMLGLHAYVAADQRGLTVISALLKEVDSYCSKHGIALICGFANPRFSIVKTRIFKWNIVCWLGFQKEIEEKDLDAARRKRFRFNYSQKWFNWRFGQLQNQYLSRYSGTLETVQKQLLKTTATTSMEDIAGAEGWSPSSTYQSDKEGQFCQPFSIRIYDKQLLEEGILDHNNWAIEMGDSDTFQYTPWEKRID